MIIAIFAKTEKIAAEHLMKIIGEMKYKDVEYISMYPPRARLMDGTTYFALPLSDKARGLRYHKAFVHSAIDVIDNKNNYNIIACGLIDGNDIEYFR
jgi:hypothetical protein